jgi:membrane-associated phospholipid phosphatase
VTPTLLSPPDRRRSSFPLRRHHFPGWILVLAGLIVTLLTPRLTSGFWHELGRAITDRPYSPYNDFLILSITILLYLAYAARSRAAFYRVAAVLGVETALFLLIKGVTWFGFHRFPRPSGHDGGFPSGHTAAACALAYLLTERWPKLAPVWYAFAALVGWARWASGAHYPYQVVAGAILGLAVAVTLAHRFPERPTAPARDSATS